MNATLAVSTLRLPPRAAVCPDALDDVCGRVQMMIHGTASGNRNSDRRSSQRFPFPRLIHFTPVDDDPTCPVGETIVGVGRQLSEEGLDFYHREPLPYRRVIATVQQEAGPPIGLLLDLTWCRFNRYGWYDSGGRFLRVVPSPVTDVEAAGDAGF